MEAFLNYLKKFIEISESEESIILSKCKTRKYLKNQYIVQEGDICRFQSFIVKGKVRTFYLDNKGNEHVVMFGIENWWAADLGSFIAQTEAEFNVQCLADTEVIQLSHSNTEALFIELPKMERFFRLIIQNAYIKTQKRIVQNYALSAKERYLEFCKEYPQLEQRIPQYMIASYLGITKEFLSSIRGQLDK